MKYNVTMSERAYQTYDTIKQQLIARWGVNIAEEFEIKTLKVLEMLSHSPTLYQATSFDRSLRKCVIHKNCSMFYRISEYQVKIIYFWDNRQQPML